MKVLGDNMDCKEFEHLITDYIDRKLDYRQLMEFKKHMENCENCKEELTIQFLVTEGMARLEDGSAFDLQKELNVRLEETKKTVKFHKTFVDIGFILEVIAILIIAAVVLWIIF